MNVLMIGTDITLAKDREKVIGDSQERHLQYGKYLSKLFIIVPSGNGKLDIKNLSDNVVVYPVSSRSMVLFVWNAYHISKEICTTHKIDIITTQDPLLTGIVGYLLKRKYNIPLNVQMHGDYLDNHYWLSESKWNYFLNIIGNFVIRKADSIRVVSNRIKAKLEEKKKLRPEKIVVLPVFINIEQITRKNHNADLKKRYSGYKHYALFVGRLSKEKNVDGLLIAASDVIKRKKETLFLIVGDGPEKNRLMKMAKDLQIENNVKFEGNVRYDRLPGYYQSCDIFVLPSRHEGWGRVAVEAMANGKAVIVSDVSGVSELLTKGLTGLTFPVNQPQVLAEKILYLLDHPELIAKIGDAGRQMVTEIMDMEKNVHKYRNLYEETIRLASWKKG